MCDENTHTYTQTGLPARVTRRRTPEAVVSLCVCVPVAFSPRFPLVGVCVCVCRPLIVWCWLLRFHLFHLLLSVPRYSTPAPRTRTQCVSLLSRLARQEHEPVRSAASSSPYTEKGRARMHACIHAHWMPCIIQNIALRARAMQPPRLLHVYERYRLTCSLLTLFPRADPRRLE